MCKFKRNGNIYWPFSGGRVPNNGIGPIVQRLLPYRNTRNREQLKPPSHEFQSRVEIAYHKCTLLNSHFREEGALSFFLGIVRSSEFISCPSSGGSFGWRWSCRMTKENDGSQPTTEDDGSLNQSRKSDIQSKLFERVPDQLSQKQTKGKTNLYLACAGWASAIAAWFLFGNDFLCRSYIFVVKEWTDPFSDSIKAVFTILFMFIHSMTTSLSYFGSSEFSIHPIQRKEFSVSSCGSLDLYLSSRFRGTVVANDGLLYLGNSRCCGELPL